MRVIYRSSLGENILVSWASIRNARVITTRQKEVKNVDGELVVIPDEVSDIAFVTFLPAGQVLYRKRTSGPQNEDAPFEIVPVEAVIEKLKACGHPGPFDDLEALLPSKIKIENRPNDPNVLPISDEKTTAEAREIPSNDARLARAYVEWVEKLPEEELFRHFRHGKRGERPDRAMKAFISDHMPDPDDRIHFKTASKKIGIGLTERSELRSRLNVKIDEARRD